MMDFPYYRFYGCLPITVITRYAIASLVDLQKSVFRSFGNLSLEDSGISKHLSMLFQ